MIRTTSAVTLAAVLSPLSAPWASGDTWTVPGDYTTIQQCIDASSSGDECLVAPGTYYENLNMVGKAITLRSQAGACRTTIDAGNDGWGIVCLSGEGRQTVIDGFTITHARAGDGAGMRNEAASPTVRNCLFIISFPPYVINGKKFLLINLYLIISRETRVKLKPFRFPKKLGLVSCCCRFGAS